jgi:hypothetical protein
VFVGSATVLPLLGALVSERAGGSSDKLGADEGGHPTPVGGVQWGVKSRGLAIRLNSYLTAKKKIN